VFEEKRTAAESFVENPAQFFRVACAHEAIQVDNFAAKKARHPSTPNFRLAGCSLPP